jgi:mannose-6-phosphate isomerase-like protein (cupin superfamily)
LGNHTWEGVPILKYKEEPGTHFKQITRQVLSDCSPDFKTQLRYFEIAPGGYSTLERHQHVHQVLIGRGSGHCLVGGQVHPLAMHDTVIIPPLTWHQFRATGSDPLGFYCIVNCDRDRPQLPSAEDLKALAPSARDFIRI